MLSCIVIIAQVLQEAADAAPADFVLRLELGKALGRARHVKVALIRVFNRLIATNFAGAERRQEAQAALLSAIALNGSSAAAHTALGMLYAKQLRQARRAQAELRKACEVLLLARQQCVTRAARAQERGVPAEPGLAGGDADG